MSLGNLAEKTRILFAVGAVLLLAACTQDDTLTIRYPMAIAGSATIQPFGNQAAAIYYDAEVTTTYRPASSANADAGFGPKTAAPEKFRQIVTLYVAK